MLLPAILSPKEWFEALMYNNLILSIFPASKGERRVGI